MNHPPKRIRLAKVTNFAPKKLGSGEKGLMAFARAAHEQEVAWTLFCHSPMHPVVAEALARYEVPIGDLGALERSPLTAWRTFRRDFDVVQLNLIAPRAPVAIAAYLAWPTSVVFVDRLSGEATESESARRAVGKLLDRVTMLRVEKYVGVSEYVRSRGQERFGLPDERTAVQYNGIAEERFATVPVPQPGGTRGSPVMILAVGALIPEKGFDVLLRALAKASESSWRLRIAGEGPERSRLEELAAELGIEERIDFLGLRDDVDALAKEADVFVHPAIWQEAFGYTVIEGMAARCCVLASQVGGIPELMVDEEEGLLLPPGDEDAWAQAIRRCVGDAALRGRLASAGRSRVLRDFTIERRMSTELALIKGAAPGAPRA